jgi:glycosyltransferase involved in cell wall biosynthesis
MKIAVIAPTQIPARRANTIQVMKMTQAFCELGHEVRLLTPRGKVQPSATSWSELAHHYGLSCEFPVVWLRAGSRLRSYDYGLQAVLWAHRWGADLLYTRLPQAAVVASLSGMRTIFEVHDYPQGTMGPVLFTRFLKGRGAWKLVVITQSLADDLRERLAAPGAPLFTLVAPDGVDLARYMDLPSQAEARQGLIKDSGMDEIAAFSFIAGYTGHLYPGRGIKLILDLAARLPDVFFLIVGGEPGKLTWWQNEVESRGLTNISLVGFVPNSEVPRYQAACDILLMPYQRRVAASSGGDIAPYLSPMKLFEYMACGRLILSSDLPVFGEVLSPENAVLLPPDEVNAWVAAIQTVRSDPQDAIVLGAQARQDASRYTWKARAERLLEGWSAQSV